MKISQEWTQAERAQVIVRMAAMIERSMNLTEIRELAWFIRNLVAAPQRTCELKRREVFLLLQEIDELEEAPDQNQVE